MTSIETTELFETSYKFWKPYYTQKRRKSSQEYYKTIDDILDKFYDNVYIEYLKQSHFLGIFNARKEILKLRNSIEQTEWFFNKDLNCDDCHICGQPLIGYVSVGHCPCKMKVHKDCLYRCMTETKEYKCPYCRHDLSKMKNETKEFKNLSEIQLENMPPKFITKENFKDGLLQIINGTSTDTEFISNKWIQQAEEMRTNDKARQVFKEFIDVVNERFEKSITDESDSEE